jgi:adenylate kinase
MQNITIGRRGLLLLPILAIGPLLAQSKPPLVIILLGPPGGGKSTQAEKITAEFGIPAVSTGELLRAEVKAATPLGQRIGAAMKRGELVGDDVVNELVTARFEKPDAAGGLILDGYPRNVSQAKYLSELLAKRKLGTPRVLNFIVTKEELIKRLGSRGRADDKPEVIAERLAVYEKETKPLVDYYSSDGVQKIETVGTPDEVYQRVREAIRSK